MTELLNAQIRDWSNIAVDSVDPLGESLFSPKKSPVGSILQNLIKIEKPTLGPRKAIAFKAEYAKRGVASLGRWAKKGLVSYLDRPWLGSQVNVKYITKDEV